VAAWSGGTQWTQTDAGVGTSDDTRASVVAVDTVTDVLATVVSTSITRTHMT